MTNTRIKIKYLPIEFVYLLRRAGKGYDAPITIDTGKTRMVAHRGLSGIHRENTIASFAAAGALNYFGIETDVHRTADGGYVIIHDDSTGRVSATDVNVEATTMEVLREIRLYPKNNETDIDAVRIPTLREYVQCCREHAKICVLELKNHFPAEDVNKIIDIIEEEGYLSQTIFISFDMENMLNVKRRSSELRAQYLTTRWTPTLAKTLADHGLDLDIYWRELNNKRLKELHSFGIEVNCWTVDDVAFAKTLIDWGVDYITSNIITSK